jgi:hypothetical protein
MRISIENRQRERDPAQPQAAILPNLGIYRLTHPAQAVCPLVQSIREFG